MLNYPIIVDECMRKECHSPDSINLKNHIISLQLVIHIYIFVTTMVLLTLNDFIVAAFVGTAAANDFLCLKFCYSICYLTTGFVQIVVFCLYSNACIPHNKFDDFL